jgi:hypothetical protein
MLLLLMMVKVILSSGSEVVGNIIYQHGMAVITNQDQLQW